MTQAAGPGARVDDALHFSILGRRFEAHGVPLPVAGWLREHWHFSEHDDYAPASGYRIALDGLAGPPDCERIANAAAATTAPGWRGRDDEWEMGTPEAGVRLSLGATEARVAGWGLDSAAFATEWPAAVQLALCEAVRASGLIPLHAAVAARDGDGVAFLAPSGTGKSTTLVRAIRAGWTPVAEDFAWLDPETLAVYGWDRGIRLWPEGLALVCEVDGERWCAGADGKLVLDYAALGAAATRRRGRLTRLALLVRDGAALSQWEPLAPHEAVRALWEATGVPLAPRVRAWTARQLPRLIAGLRFERLRLGGRGSDTSLEL